MYQTGKEYKKISKVLRMLLSSVQTLFKTFCWYQTNLHSSARKLRMACTWTFQHGKDLKHKAKSTCHRLQQNKVKVLERLSVSWPQYHLATVGKSVQIMQDISARLYRNWRLFAKKNGQLYHLRRWRASSTTTKKDFVIDDEEGNTWGNGQ